MHTLPSTSDGNLILVLWVIPMSHYPKHKKQKLQWINFTHLPGSTHRMNLTTTYAYYQEDGKTAVRSGQLVVPLLSVDGLSPEVEDQIDESYHEDLLLIDPEMLSMEASQAQKRKQTIGVHLNRFMFSDWPGAGRISHWWLGFRNVQHSSMNCSDLKEGETMHPKWPASPAMHAHRYFDAKTASVWSYTAVIVSSNSMSGYYFIVSRWAWNLLYQPDTNNSQEMGRYALHQGYLKVIGSSPAVWSCHRWPLLQPEACVRGWVCSYWYQRHSRCCTGLLWMRNGSDTCQTTLACSPIPSNHFRS